MTSALLYLQPTLNRLFKNCIILILDYGVAGGLNWPPEKVTVHTPSLITVKVNLNGSLLCLSSGVIISIHKTYLKIDQLVIIYDQHKYAYLQFKWSDDAIKWHLYKNPLPNITKVGTNLLLFPYVVAAGGLYCLFSLMILNSFLIPTEDFIRLTRISIVLQPTFLPK